MTCSPWISTEWMSSGISAMPLPGATTTSAVSASLPTPGTEPSSVRSYTRLCSVPSTAAMQAQVVWLCGTIFLPGRITFR
ncbi:hypothetical protein D9M68_650850 [compost metagenome]